MNSHTTTELDSRTFRSLEEVQRAVLSTLLADGSSVAPRGIPTREVSPFVFTLLEPRNRCISSRERKWSLPLAIGEFCWHVSASRSLSFLEYYAGRWRDFSDDGQTIQGSCYGYRVFSKDSTGESQWDRVRALLKADPASRRAILDLAGPLPDSLVAARDVPCATTLQFLIREGRLHAVASLRSNDAILGLPYDVFLFTMLQELMACQVGVELGAYHHVSASLHLYERHDALARRMLAESVTSPLPMPAMSSDGLQPFLRLEEELRGQDIEVPRILDSLPRFWRDLAMVLRWYRHYRAARQHQLEAPKVDNASPYASYMCNLASAGKTSRD